MTTGRLPAHARAEFEDWMERGIELLAQITAETLLADSGDPDATARRDCLVGPAMTLWDEAIRKGYLPINWHAKTRRAGWARFAAQSGLEG